MMARSCVAVVYPHQASSEADLKFSKSTFLLSFTSLDFSDLRPQLFTLVAIIVLRIEEFQKKLQEVRLEANLEQIVI